MRRYSIDFIQKIKELRKKEKLTFRELERKVGIPASTIRNWCDDVVGTRWDKILLANEKKREEINCVRKKDELKSCVGRGEGLRNFFPLPGEVDRGRPLFIIKKV